MKLGIKHIQEFTDFGSNEPHTQYQKVSEEEFELYQKIINEDREKAIDEALDLITATYNLLHCLGVNQEHIDKHKEKLERYRKEGKHGKVED